MDAIILFSHGSVLCGAEQNLLQIAQAMELRGDAPTVRVGFLNYSEPTFESAIEACVARGAHTIHVAPYFLVEGKFVKEELPSRITEARKLYPRVDVRIGRAIVDDVRLAAAILEASRDPKDTTFWRESGAQAELFCRDSPKCPRNGTPECPATRKRLEHAT